VPEALKIFVALTSADGYKQLLSNLGPDPMEPSLQLVTLGSKLPGLLHSLAVWVVKSILGDGVFASIFGE
jgi:amidase